MKKSIFLFIIGITVGIIIWNLIILSQPRTVYAASESSESGLIVISGLINESKSALWVLDARSSEYSPTMCLYIPYRDGIRLAGVRRIKYDLKLSAYKDYSSRNLSVGYLKRNWEKEAEKLEKKGKQLFNFKYCKFSILLVIVPGGEIIWE